MPISHLVEVIYRFNDIRWLWFVVFTYRAKYRTVQLGYRIVASLRSNRNEVKMRLKGMLLMILGNLKDFRLLLLISMWQMSPSFVILIIIIIEAFFINRRNRPDWISLCVTFRIPLFNLYFNPTITHSDWLLNATLFYQLHVAVIHCTIFKIRRFNKLIILTWRMLI